MFKMQRDYGPKTGLFLSDVVRQRLADLLTGKACKKINFYAAGQHISGTQYAYLAIALTSPPNGKRGIEIAKMTEEEIAKMKPDDKVAASYDPNTNRLLLPNFDYGTLHVDKMTLVHEMTHAAIDEFGGRNKTLVIDHEVCAYIAAAMFNLYAAVDPKSGPYGWLPTPGKAAHPWRAAWALALKLISRLGESPIKLSSLDIQPLRHSILVHPHYRREARKFTHNSGVGL